MKTRAGPEVHGGEKDMLRHGFHRERNAFSQKGLFASPRTFWTSCRTFGSKSNEGPRAQTLMVTGFADGPWTFWTFWTFSAP